MLSSAKAIVFDAYGTLFDIYSVGQKAEAIWPGHGAALSTLWRDKQMEYTRLRTLSGRYTHFEAVTADALAWSCDKLGLAYRDADLDRLMEAYMVLPAFPEAPRVLKELAARGARLAILSNGTPSMLKQAVASDNLDTAFDAVLSVDAVQKYKTAPEAYDLACTRLNVSRENILFVSSNAWDVCGASWFGFRTVWINRAQAPMERLGVTPDAIGSDLTVLIEPPQVVTPATSSSA
jgi:2-haloacid dehalogenase